MSGRVAGRKGDASPGPAESGVAGKRGRGPTRLVEPESLLGLSLGDVLLGLLETGEGQPGPAPAGPAAAEEGPVLRLRMPDGRVEREPLLGGFWRRDRAGGLTVPRIATRREGKPLACKLYRVGEGRGDLPRGDGVSRGGNGVRGGSLARGASPGGSGL